MLTAPAHVYAAGRTGATPSDDLDESWLRNALTVRVRRRVRRDSTLALDGADYEVDLGFLAGRLVTVARCLVDPGEPPWIEHEGKPRPLHPVDPVRNARRRRAGVVAPTSSPQPTVAFDPAGALLDRAAGRRPQPHKETPS